MLVLWIMVLTLCIRSAIHFTRSKCEIFFKKKSKRKNYGQLYHTKFVDGYRLHATASNTANTQANTTPKLKHK